MFSNFLSSLYKLMKLRPMRNYFSTSLLYSILCGIKICVELEFYLFIYLFIYVYLLRTFRHIDLIYIFNVCKI